MYIESLTPKAMMSITSVSNRKKLSTNNLWPQ